MGCVSYHIYETYETYETQSRWVVRAWNCAPSGILFASCQHWDIQPGTSNIHFTLAGPEGPVPKLIRSNITISGIIIIYPVPKPIRDAYTYKQILQDNICPKKAEILESKLYSRGHFVSQQLHCLNSY